MLSVPQATRLEPSLTMPAAESTETVVLSAWVEAMGERLAPPLVGSVI